MAEAKTKPTSPSVDDHLTAKSGTDALRPTWFAFGRRACRPLGRRKHLAP
jgi:hypothetical protein